MNFCFCVGTVLILVIAHLSLGDSYHSGGCDVCSSGATGGVVTLDFGGLITLEHRRIIPGVLTRVVSWCTRGVVLITAGAVGWVDVW